MASKRSLYKWCFFPSAGDLSSSLSAICRAHRGLLPSGDSGGMRQHCVIQEELRLSISSVHVPDKYFLIQKLRHCLNTRLL